MTPTPVILAPTMLMNSASLLPWLLAATIVMIISIVVFFIVMSVIRARQTARVYRAAAISMENIEEYTNSVRKSGELILTRTRDALAERKEKRDAQQPNVPEALSSEESDPTH